MGVDLLSENNNTLVLLIMLTCCKMPKNDLYDTVRMYNKEIFDVMIMNQTFLKEILVPISDPKSKINEMILSWEAKKIEVKHIKNEDLTIFHYIIIGSGLEYVLNHLKLVGKPYHRYKLTDTSDYSEKLDKEANEKVSEDYPELLLTLLETLDESFSSRELSTDQAPEYQSVLHLQSIIFNNLFKIVINCFRLLKSSECNYLIYLKIIKKILCTYLKKYKKEIGKFKPLILVIIENVMQLRKEIGKKKELNDIMLNLPVGLKHLIEYMPFIFEFIQESFHNKDESNAVETLTHWIRVISNLNDITDPILTPNFSEFSADLFDTFLSNYSNKTSVYGTIFWLLCKLGPKCRIYNDDKVIKIKNDTGNGMKIFFKDKDNDQRPSSNLNIFSLGVEDILEQNSKYIEHIDKTIDCLKPLVLFYINKNSVDVDVVKRCIKNVLTDDSNAAIFNETNVVRLHDHPHCSLLDQDSKICRSKQIRSFELILRMIFAVCLIQDKKENVNKTTELLKYLARHFTLLYICKNGRLVDKVDDEFSLEEKELLKSDDINVGSDAFLRTTLCEMNPLIFIDILCELFHDGSQQIILTEIFKLLRSFYPNEEDYDIALSRLEFIDILFKKICYMAYNEGIQKKTGCISAITMLIEHSPKSLLARYNITILESMIVLIKGMLVSYGGLPNKLISNLLLKLTRKNNYFIDQTDMLQKIINLVFSNFKDLSWKGRRLLESFLDTIRKAYQKDWALPTIKTKRNMKPKLNPYPEMYKKHLENLGSYIFTLLKSPRKLDYVLEGYSSIENLISEVDIILYLFKHNWASVINSESFIYLISQLVEVMEYEIEIFNDTIVSEKNGYATKYMLVEKLHISNNKIHDIYTSTKYPHRLFNLSFEKKEKRERYITKGSSKNNDEDIYDFYYKTYLEKSLEAQVETRNDFDTYLNELFPNHDQHIELMILILHLFSSGVKVMEDYVASKEEGSSEKKSVDQVVSTLKYKLEILMMAWVLRIENKLSDAAEKNLSCVLKEFRYSEKIYEHLEVILNKKLISNDTYYKEIGIIKLFRILYKTAVDEEKIKKIFESAVDGIKAVESSVQKDPPGINTINHCRFVYEMINIFISVNWFSNNEDQFMRSFDRKVFDIATNMHKKVVKIPCSGSDLIDKFSFKDLMWKYMNERNTWGNHWQIWLQNKRLDILELILDVLDMDESYPFRDRFIRYYDLRILWRDMMNTSTRKEDKIVSGHMRTLINKYFHVLNKRIPSAFVNTIKFLELLFSILKDRISKTPESLSFKENRFICKIILDFFISFIKFSKNPCTLLLYTVELYSDCNSFLFEDFNKLLSNFIPVHFSTKKISSLIKGTLKCFERTFQCVVNVLSCLWVPVLNKVSKQGKAKFQEVIDFDFFKKLIKSLLDPTQGYVYEWFNKKDDEVELERPIIEVYRVLWLCMVNHDLAKLDDYHKNAMIDFFWKMIKLRYNFKQWHLYAISEFFKNLDMRNDRVRDVYYSILESNANENGRGRMLQNMAVDNIIDLVDLTEVATMKNAVNFLKQHDGTMFHIADILIKYEGKFFNEVKNLYNEITSILHKLLSSSYSAQFEKKKLVIYLCEICIKWMIRIIDRYSLPGSTPTNRLIEEDYKKAYYKIKLAVSIWLQKELEYIIRLANTQNMLEIMLKFLILVKDMQEIHPMFCIESRFGLELKINDDDGKDKRMFILNIKQIIMDAYLNDEVRIESRSKREKFTEILEVYYSSSSIKNQAESHPLTYSLIASAFLKLANWAKKTPEDREWIAGILEQWIIKDLSDVNAVIEERAQSQFDNSVLLKILPHLSVRICHELSKEHSDIIDHTLVIKIIWIYRKLFLFLDGYFKKSTTNTGIPSVITTEFKNHYKGIHFPQDVEIKQQINDNNYSQITIIYSIKVASIKMHEFDIGFLDEFLKLLDSIITYCKSEELSLIMYEVYECLLLSPKPNPLGVKIDLSFVKKVWLGSCLLKKAVGESSKILKDRMESIITEFLTTQKLNNTDETMNLYDYAVFFFTNAENKKKIQRAFEISFGGGLFNKIRFILENKETIEFTQMNSPPIIMRKISEAIMSHFDGIVATSWQQKNSLILRDLCNEITLDEDMESNENEPDDIEKILIEHKKYIEDTDVYKSKFYCQNVKKLFPQVWKTFSKEQKQYLAFCIKTFFMNYIKFLHNQKKKINPEFEAFPNELLEILQQLEPQIVLGPEFHLKATTKNNCWINCILTLEEQIKALPKYDKFPLILNELYSTLEQHDYFVDRCRSNTSKRALTYSQFGMWEEVNTEFNSSLK